MNPEAISQNSEFNDKDYPILLTPGFRILQFRNMYA
jgi:hypothetical protein